MFAKAETPSPYFLLFHLRQCVVPVVGLKSPIYEASFQNRNVDDDESSFRLLDGHEGTHRGLGALLVSPPSGCWHE
jgi:hypothetical protein